MSILNEFLRVWPLTVCVITFAYALLYHSMSAWFMLLCLLLNGFIWMLASMLVQILYPKLGMRPQTKSCYFIESSNVAKNNGLPSGHCQSMAVFATWMVLLTWKLSTNTVLKTTVFTLAAALIYLMMYSRSVYYKCHTWTQSVVGSIIGVCTAIMMRRFV
jgi:membrane-associated phospholipid phosphatase